MEKRRYHSGRGHADAAREQIYVLSADKATINFVDRQELSMLWSNIHYRTEEKGG